MMSEVFSLRRKLLTWLLLPMFILWSLSTAAMCFLTLRFAHQAYDYALVDSTYDLAGQILYDGGKPSLNLSDAALRMFLSDQLDSIYYNVLGRDGVLIAGNADLSTPDVARSTGVPSVRNDTFKGRKVRIATLFFLTPGLPVDQTVTIQVAETLNKRHQLAGQVIATVLLPQFLLFVLPALLLWIGIGRGLAPLSKLQKEIAARSYRDLSPVEESSVPQEVRPIIHEINELMRRLGKTLEAQQKFIADAAHQLRTPLSGLKTQTELALRHNDPESLRHSLQHLNRSTNRTVHLVNQMLALAQVEFWANKALDLKPLDLRELAEAITMEWVPTALRKNIDLGYEGAHEAIIAGDRVLIKMSIDNLLDNSIRYSSMGGYVTVRVETTDQSVILTIEDNGPGIPAEERKAVFQRFHRIPNRSGDGSGLGLSIVQEVAIAHGSAVVLDEPSRHQGLVVRITFPQTKLSLFNPSSLNDLIG